MYLLTHELTSFLYNPSKGGGEFYARLFFSFNELSVLAFSTINHDLMPITIPF